MGEKGEQKSLCLSRLPRQIPRFLFSWSCPAVPDDLVHDQVAAVRNSAEKSGKRTTILVARKIPRNSRAIYNDPYFSLSKSRQVCDPIGNSRLPKTFVTFPEIPRVEPRIVASLKQ